MKHLYLLRHAKSDWQAAYGRDHDRPLNARGREAAARLGRLLAAIDRVPQTVYTSTAVRARTTVEIAWQAGEWSEAQVVEVEALYGAGIREVLAVMRSVPDDVDTILLAGHEPGWSNAVSQLIGGGRVRMSTATLARIDFDQPTWSKCGPGKGTLGALLPPRMLD